MQRNRIGLIVMLLSVMLFAGVARAEVFVGRVQYKGWKNAYQLSNGTVSVIIVPSIGGRIMHYGYIGGSNVLWENPAVAGQPIPYGEWPNTGGDKVWPWPQDDWGKLHPHAWPPPPEADQMAHIPEVVGKDTLRLTSPIIQPYGVRIIREIRLAPTGTKVFLTTKFRQEREGRFMALAPWVVTQIPATDWVLARLLPESDQLQGGYRPSDPSEFKSVTLLPQGVLKVERNPEKATKLFTEADLLATYRNNTLFTVRFAPDAPIDNSSGTYQPGDRAQIYAHPDDPAFIDNGTPTYIELEMTAPLKPMQRGETNTIEQIWELRRVPEAERTPEGVAEILKAI